MKKEANNTGTCLNIASDYIRSVAFQSQRILQLLKCSTALQRLYSLSAIYFTNNISGLLFVYSASSSTQSHQCRVPDSEQVKHTCTHTV